MVKGYVSLVLHSHMPFTRHPDVEDPLEERWIFEAMSECYLPLIKVYDELLEENISFKITMSITPTLMEMLQDEYLNNRYFEYLTKSIELAKQEIDRTKDHEDLNNISKFYYKRLIELLNIYIKYDSRLMNAFKKFDNLGVLEIITCAATHGLLPLLMVNRETVVAQIATAVQSYIDCIGHSPKGIWLPECAYTYSLDTILEEFGLEYFISENKAIFNASPKPIYGSYAPIATPNGISIFGRDVEASHQVWSHDFGYPGDVDYREFYRDIGHELDITYVAPYINQRGIRVDTGMKYYRITGNTEEKALYNRENALKKVKEHAKHFAEARNIQIGNTYRYMNVKPILTCPYDTELFGHWWFEGPDFIKELLRLADMEYTNFEFITPSRYLKENPSVQCCVPSPSTWGENGDFSVWLNPSNDWIYSELHKCGGLMVNLANKYKDPNEIQKRALNQAARELMLAEASDWAFIINNNTTVEYATVRVKNHLQRFKELYEGIKSNNIGLDHLARLEEVDNIFLNINYENYKNI